MRVDSLATGLYSHKQYEVWAGVKRLISLLVGLTSLSVLVTAGFAPLAEAYSSYGAGTSAKPYRIATCSQLKEINSSPSSYYVLVSNIDCTGTTVASVGNFTGTLDGQNHTISNITITGNGLFGESNNATLKNLTLSNGSINATGDSGSFVGWAITSTLSNLHSNLAVPGNSSSWVGGIAGLMDGSALTFSSYSGTISGGFDTGGLVGVLNSGGSTITNSFFDGSLTANSQNAGGLAGEMVTGNILSTYSAGTIHMNGQTPVGGLVGFTDAGLVNNSFAANTMLGTSTGNGAVFGTFSSPGTTRNNVYYDQYLANDNNTNSLPCAGTDQGSGNCTAENVNNAAPSFFKNTTTNGPFGVWDFTNDWIKTAGYPTLRNIASFNAPSGIPHSGDANGDGTLDSYQANVTNIQDSNNVWSTAQVPSAGLCTFDNISSTPITSVMTDRSYTTKTSLDGFSLYCPTAGMTVPVTLIYPQHYDLTGLVLRYYDSTLHTWSTVPGAVFSNVTINGTAETEVTYNITDGGALDQDGTANGVIVDPVALASSTVTSSAGVTATPAAPATGAGRPDSTNALAAVLSCIFVFVASSAAGYCYRHQALQRVRNPFGPSNQT